MLELILGGARSGKSRLAEKLAAESGLEVVYIATSQALDGEMSARVAQHRARRPAHWALVEEPVALARVLREQAREERCLLVDCLTLWLTNLLLLEDTSRLESERDVLKRAAMFGFPQEFAALQGVLADHIGVQASFILPLLCYGYIIFYGLVGARTPASATQGG